MNLHFYTSQFKDQSGWTDECLLAPLRMAMGGGRVYELIRNDGNVLTHGFSYQDEMAKTDSVAKRILGVFLLLIGFPIVFGACLVKALDSDYTNEYRELARLSEDKNIINGDKLQEVYHHDPELAENPNFRKEVSEPISELFYNVVGHGQAAVEMTDWLLNIVPDPRRYFNIPELYADTAALLLQSYLKEIYQVIETLPVERQRAALLELKTLSESCPPTWVEGSKQILRKIMPGSPSERIGRYTQQVKEEVAIHITQQGDEREWHEVQRFRFLFGDLFGLSRETERLDTTSAAFEEQAPTVGIQDQRNAATYKQTLRVETLVTGIGRETRNTQGWANDLTDDLLKGIRMDLKTKGSTASPHDVMDAYYTEENGYSDEGIKAILTALDYLEV